MAAPIMKKSRQRDAILANLQSRCDHPTADMIYMDIRKEIPNISLGTVYRNLSLLADHGMIIRLSIDGKAERFDCITGTHYHFVCQECGEVEDLEIQLPTINDVAQEGFTGQITGHNTFFYGLCADCLKKQQQ